MYYAEKSQRDGILYITPLESNFFPPQKYWPKNWKLRELPDDENPEEGQKILDRYYAKREKQRRAKGQSTDGYQPRPAGRPRKYLQEKGRPIKPERPKQFYKQPQEIQDKYRQDFKIYKSKLRTWYNIVNPEYREKQHQYDRKHYRDVRSQNPEYKARDNARARKWREANKERFKQYYINWKERLTPEAKRHYNDRNNESQKKQRANCTDNYFRNLSPERQKALRMKRYLRAKKCEA